MIDDTDDQLFTVVLVVISIDGHRQGTTVNHFRDKAVMSGSKGVQGTKELEAGV